MNSHPSVILTGPTASGKTALAHQLVEGGFFSILINGDSRQFYKGLDVLTDKPSEDHQKRYGYRLLSFLNPDDSFSAYDFSERVKDLLGREKKACVVGGSPFYVDVLLKGLPDHPPIPVAVREKIQRSYEEKGLDFLQNELKHWDLETYEKIDIKNPSRLMRALEYVLYFKEPFSAFQKRLLTQKSPLGGPSLLLICFLPREELYRRIERRVDEMFKRGALEEGRALFESGSKRGACGTLLTAIGYREMSLFFQGKRGYEEMVESIKVRTRHFAKRQITWFKSLRRALLICPQSFEKAMGVKDAWFSQLKSWRFEKDPFVEGNRKLYYNSPKEIGAIIDSFRGV